MSKVRWQDSAALPPNIPYAWPLGMAAVAALCWLGLTAWQNMDFTCVGLRAMCEERERQAQSPVTATVVLPPRALRLSLQLPPVPNGDWQPASEGCPPHYRPINGACWIGVEEPPPCPTSYHYQGKCYAPLPARDRRPGVSGP